MRIRIYCTLLMGCCALAAAPAFAHHSFTAEFDPDKIISVTGVLTKVDWVNPHTYFYVEEKDENGTVVEWEIECKPPGMLHKAGVNKETFKIGEVVTVDGYVAKDGSKHLTFARTFHFASGRTMNIMNDEIQAPPGK